MTAQAEGDLCFSVLLGSSASSPSPSSSSSSSTSGLTPLHVRDGPAGGRRYHARVPFPLPNTITVIGVGDWKSAGGKEETMVANLDLVLASDYPPVRLGSFSGETCALCSTINLDSKAQERADAMADIGCMAKVTVTLERCSSRRSSSSNSSSSKREAGMAGTSPNANANNTPSPSTRFLRAPDDETPPILSNGSGAYVRGNGDQNGTAASRGDATAKPTAAVAGKKRRSTTAASGRQGGTHSSSSKRKGIDFGRSSLGLDQSGMSTSSSGGDTTVQDDDILPSHMTTKTATATMATTMSQRGGGRGGRGGGGGMAKRGSSSSLPSSSSTTTCTSSTKSSPTTRNKAIIGSGRNHASSASVSDKTATSSSSTSSLSPPSGGAASKISSSSTSHSSSAGGIKSVTGPDGRWGHTLVMCGNSTALLFGGQGGGGSELCRDAMWLRDTTTRNWTRPPASKTKTTPAARMGHACAVGDGRAYVFGGAKYKRFFKDVNVFDPALGTWEALPPTGGAAPTRSYHTCTHYRGELLVWGGVVPQPDPTPDESTNELHVFAVAERNWYVPIVSGELPKPRSGHSATVMGQQLVIFGGWDQPAVFNDAFALDLATMEFSKLELQGTAPSPRSWHCAVRLDDTRVLIHGGYDGDEALNDAFVLDLGRQAWRTVKSPLFPHGRAGHSGVVSSTDEEGRRLLIFGGGDNEGRYFNTELDMSVADLIADLG